MFFYANLHYKDAQLTCRIGRMATLLKHFRPMKTAFNAVLEPLFSFLLKGIQSVLSSCLYA